MRSAPRISTSSVQPRCAAAISPAGTPIAQRAPPRLPRPRASSGRRPMIMESTSRPKGSVPKGCAGDGVARAVQDVDAGRGIGRPDQGDRRHEQHDRGDAAAEQDAEAAHVSRLRRRGSIIAFTRSTRKLMTMTTEAKSRTRSCTRTRSRWPIAWNSSEPSPGRANTFSMMIVPASRKENCRP